MERHAGIIRKVSKIYREHREDRQDLFQEIILQLWKSYHTFRGQSEFSTWMYRVALNTAITFLKNDERKKRNELLVEPAETREDPFNDKANERLEKLYEAARSLSAVEKAVLFLWLEGQTYKELAQQLGISEGNARVRLARTKEKLQQIINQSPENEYRRF